MKNSILLFSFVLAMGESAVHRVPLPARPEPAFKLELSATDNIIQAGTEVKVVLCLTNTSRKTLVFDRWVGGPDVQFRIEVRGSSGKEAPFTQSYRALLRGDLQALPTGSVHRYYVSPGESTKEKIVVTKQYDLSIPGKYFVEGNRFDETTKTTIRSNKIIITVTN